MEGSNPAPERACTTCGSPLAPGQGWCLECGQSQGPRRTPSTWRVGSTIALLAAVLALGAAAAAYAAFTADPTQPLTVAAAPPAAAPTTTAAPAPTTTTTAPTSTATVRSIAPPPPITKATAPPPPAKVVPETITQSEPPTDTTTTGTTKTDTTKTTETTTTSTPQDTPGLQEIELGPEAGSVYDPYDAAVDQTDPADTYDDKPNTVFTLSTSPDATTMGVGLDYNLVEAREVSAIQIRTPTPGFTVEVYGAAAGRPADVLSSDWKHLASASKVASASDSDGTALIQFTAGRYRHLLLWFTVPPTAAAGTGTQTAPAAPTIGISDVKVLD